MNLKTTLQAPKRPNHIPLNSQWLSGEGAGSWFYIERNKSQFIITRYSPEGSIECTGDFITEELGFSIEADYRFIHLSHCKVVRIEQNNKTYIFNRV